MSTTSLELTRQYSSFSGTDIRVVIAGQTFASIQALSYAVQREKGPVYVMGYPDPRSFSRGKRGIAGTVISLLFDRHPLFQAPFNTMKVVLDNDEIIATNANIQATGNNANLLDLENLGVVDFSSGNISEQYQVHSAFYFDQLPPMDFIVIAASEYGNAATMRIYGAEYLNEGSGFSVDDMVIENQMTYIARSMLPWQPLGKWDLGASDSFIPAA